MYLRGYFFLVSCRFFVVIDVQVNFVVVIVLALFLQRSTSTICYYLNKHNFLIKFVRSFQIGIVFLYGC